MPKKSLEFGLYSWFPGYGYAHIHPANRREFEQLEPHNKVFEKVSEINGWLLLRYADEEFKVRPDLFTAISWLPFTFGEWVKPANQPSGPVAEITDIFWNVSEDAPLFGLRVGKQKLDGVYRLAQLQAA
ncbi:hypothetical protein EFA69_04405 [Rufibacter immobilis]|uniref:Uncharacterized protein n=1 Tax=Rufibacter immobilis TaxID=1348778 RepID=A0A3M9N499_9BACT|nr:hypothetical protein [Rufibacter immobilis]RNI32566.1 hypothetical protein EFA69_04405 [Rufibacter immobilis]